MSLTVKPIKVHLKIASHRNCDIKKHDDCDWDQILKNRLEKLFPDMHVYNITPSGDEVSFDISFTNRPTRVAEVKLRLYTFFRYTPEMKIESLELNQ